MSRFARDGSVISLVDGAETEWRSGGVRTSDDQANHMARPESVEAVPPRYAPWHGGQTL